MVLAAHKEHRGSLTYRDLWHTPEDGNRYEIINGEVYVTPPPYTVHQRVSRNLERILDRHVTENDLGEVLHAPVGVVLEKPSGVQPDIIFIAKARLSIIQEKAVFGAPELVVEIVSSSTASRDRSLKKELYARTGVQHYWRLDPRKQVLQAFHLERGAYVLAAEHSGAAIFRPALFPRLVVRLGEVWVAK
ncbi:MAG TPA: Uma2 family endonuclease [Candidatus Margulisiibacteriota bacterium]|nr:Uma2 family endonuclease [Candidatus Margulisiibacteriota bacterium]